MAFPLVKIHKGHANLTLKVKHYQALSIHNVCLTIVVLPQEPRMSISITPELAGFKHSAPARVTTHSYILYTSFKLESHTLQLQFSGRGTGASIPGIKTYKGDLLYNDLDDLKDNSDFYFKITRSAANCSFIEDAKPAASFAAEGSYITLGQFNGGGSWKSLA